MPRTINASEYCIRSMKMEDFGAIREIGETIARAFLPLISERRDAASSDLQGHGRAGSGGLGYGLVGDDGLAQAGPECS